MSIRTAAPLPSALTCKLQAQYIVHETIPHISTHPPNQWLDGTHVFRNAPDRRRKNAKKPRVGGAEFGRKPSNVSTAYAVPTSVRLAPPLRSRCDGDHKNVLFCRVLQKICACMTAKPVACPLSRTGAS